MPLSYENLDEITRRFMSEEVDLDISQGTLYTSPRLNDQGMQHYPSLLKETVENHDDTWLADQLRHRRYLKAVETRRTRGGGVTTARVPVNAPETLAEGEFNRFYVRGL